MRDRVQEPAYILANQHYSNVLPGGELFKCIFNLFNGCVLRDKCKKFHKERIKHKKIQFNILMYNNRKLIDTVIECTNVVHSHLKKWINMRSA